MIRPLIILAGLILAGPGLAQQSATASSAPPDWFRQDVEYLTRNGGRWIADNTTFRGENEPWNAYGVEWVAGPGNGSMSGRLFGVTDSKETPENFWVFSQYWDPSSPQAVIQQYGWGAVGAGSIWPVGDGGELWMLQVFSRFDGTTYREGHRSSVVDANTYTTTAFEIDNSGKWNEKRTYRWKRVLADFSAP